MFLKAKAFRWDRFTFTSGSFLPLALAVGALALTGCDQLSGLFGATQVEAKTAEDSIEVFLTYQDALIGKDSAAVTEVFGKPKGIFERKKGKVWMYSRWLVEFDARDRVVRMERDVVATGSGVGAASPSMALPAKTAPTPRPVTSAGGIIRVSNGGQPVDLNSLMPKGRITVVDFYADWCGPCRSIAPHLEKLARENPEVALVKVDIVKWGTPVTKQHAINSVPNIRVFDRSGKQVGQSTPSFSKVKSYVEKAGG